MLKTTILTLAFIALSSLSFSQNLDSLKLLDTELLNGYKKVNKLMCKTVHSASLYEQIDLYESFLGKVTKKDFQSFQKDGDKGTILYFEFDKYFIGNAFLMGLLWGEAGKPTKQKPEEFKSKGKILVIWSFDQHSEMKKLSQDKIEGALNAE